MFRRLWDVHNKYKAELVVISSMVDGGNDNCFHGVQPQISHAPSKAGMTRINHKLSGE